MTPTPHHLDDLDIAAAAEQLKHRLQARRRAENRHVGAEWVGRDGDPTTLGHEYAYAIDSLNELVEALRRRTQ